MLGFNRKYCEVIPEQPIVEHWREIKLDTGALQSTLQDVKVTILLPSKILTFLICRIYFIGS